MSVLDISIADEARPVLFAKDGDALFDHYRHTLEELGRQPHTLALIFSKAQNKFDPHRLEAMLTLRASCGRPSSGGDCQGPAKLWRVIGVPAALDVSQG